MLSEGIGFWGMFGNLPADYQGAGLSKPGAAPRKGMPPGAERIRFLRIQVQ